MTDPAAAPATTAVARRCLWWRATVLQAVQHTHGAGAPTTLNQAPACTVA